MNLARRLERSKNSEQIDFNQIPCHNLKEKLVEVQASPKLIIEPIWEKPIDKIEGPLYQAYIKKHPAYKSIFLRQSVAKRLNSAAESLPHGINLILRAGHRPVEVQTKLLDLLAREYRLKMPSISPAEALEFARTYVSDPSIQMPPHCCGAAVDVDVADEFGNLLDFGCPVNTNSEIAFLHTSKISKAQRTNRDILLKAMLNAGFASVYSEWWHFSYGDQNWAHFYKTTHSLYDIIEPKL